MNKDKRSHKQQRAWLDKQVKERQRQKFYGKVIINFCGGNILRAEVHQSLKLEAEDGKSEKEEYENGGSEPFSWAEESQAGQEKGS